MYVYRKLLGILGAAGWLRGDSPGAALQGRVERAGRSAQINTFGGGVNEVQREIVAASRPEDGAAGAMNLTLDETQEELRGLAAQIFAGAAARPSTSRRSRRPPKRSTATLWRELAEAGLLGVAIPEAHGGLGLRLGRARPGLRGARSGGRSGAVRADRLWRRS